MPQPQLHQNPPQQARQQMNPQSQKVAKPPVAQQVTPAQSTTGPTQQSSYKNRLQEYAQKAAISFPAYRTVNEGSQKPPMFRSTVEVNGHSYTSTKAFSTRKEAELAVARVALKALPRKIRKENTALVRENSALIMLGPTQQSSYKNRLQEYARKAADTIFCKSILNEYAVKIHVDKPVYKTEQSDGLIPSFVSSLVFNGKHYVGDKGRNKKESQQLAARAVILSVLDSNSCTVISEIIKSKKVLYAAMDKVKNSCDAQTDATPVGLQAGSDVATGKGKKLVALNNNMPRTAIPEPLIGDSSYVLTKHESLHEFKILKQEESPVEAIATPMIFVPPTSEQPDLGSTSGKKRKRKNWKSKNKAEVDTEVQVAAVSSNQMSTCSAAQ